MTPKEFKELIETNTKMLEKQYDKAMGQFSSPDFKPDGRFTSDFLSLKTESNDLWDGMSLSNIESAIESFREDMAGKKKKFGYKEWLDINHEEDGEGSVELKASWYEPRDKKAYTSSAKSMARDALMKFLRGFANQPNGYSYLECKFVGLWLEEKIDTRDLCNLTFKNCQL